MCRTAWLNVAFCLSLIFFSGDCAWCNESPLVAAFDRFVPHDDIEPSIGGQLLLSELSCTACHATAVKSLQPKGGPRLDGVGVRLQADWLRRFLASPQSVKPGTTMPEVLAGYEEAEKQQVIEALVAFLSTQSEPYPEVKASGAVGVPYEFWGVGDSAAGKQLYYQVGCVACHDPADDYETAEAAPSPIDQLLEQLDPEEIEEMGLGSAVRPVKSVPHGDLVAKYTRKSLTHFLLYPERTRPSGRMPGLKLEPMEAAHIAAYLLKSQDREVLPVNVSDDAGLVATGKQLFGELGCVQCHSAIGVEAGKPSKSLRELNFKNETSCLTKRGKGQPFYPLDEVQVDALRSAVEKLADSASADEAESLDLKLLQLNCYGCHTRDELGGVGRNRKPFFETVRHVDVGDEGRLPPPLTGVGRKMKEAWLKKVLAGTGDIRPHVMARMPKFPDSVVSELPRMFSQADARQAGKQSKEPAKPQGFAEAGRKLFDTGCVECHVVRGDSLPGVVGVDLEGIASRVTYGWFHDFLLNPAELKSRTRMPTFFPNGKSQNMEVLNGDAELQIAAIWHYLREIRKQRLPEKIEKARSQDFELVPTDRPILLRTFMPEAGTHALAVGFAEKVHFAFDTETLRLAQAWRGRFLDAQGTWFERFTPPAVPLGNDRISFPSGSVVAVLPGKSDPWPEGSAAGAENRFLGYRLDSQGVPTFLYRVGSFDVTDRISPMDKNGLRRELSISIHDLQGEIGQPMLRANVGKQLQQSAAGGMTNEKNLRVEVSGDISGDGEVRTSQGQAEWLFLLKVKQQTKVEVLYRW